MRCHSRGASSIPKALSFGEDPRGSHGSGGARSSRSQQWGRARLPASACWRSGLLISLRSQQATMRCNFRQSRRRMRSKARPAIMAMSQSLGLRFLAISARRSSSMNARSRPDRIIFGRTRRSERPPPPANYESPSTGRRCSPVSWLSLAPLREPAKRQSCLLRFRPLRPRLRHRRRIVCPSIFSTIPMASSASSTLSPSETVWEASIRTPSSLRLLHIRLPPEASLLRAF